MRGRFSKMRSLLASLLIPFSLPAADLADAQQRFAHGGYDEVVQLAVDGIHDDAGNVEWPLLLGEALTATGHYAEARDALTKPLDAFPYDLRLRFAAFEAVRRVGDAEEAVNQLAEVKRLLATRAWAYRTPIERVMLGRILLLFGADPKQVLDQYFDPVKKAQPDLRESWLASGQLALDKNDFALAAKTFNLAAKKFPEDADVWFGLAQAYAPSDAEATADALAKTLNFNPNHTGARLLLADHNIDAENYAEADTQLNAALKVNPQLPAAHAYQAVLANLRADEKSEKAARAAALKLWANNPAVPHLMGRKLAQKYRFAEGAALQREALKFDPAFLPAKAQLANDLLRLGGHDDEAWQLAEEVQKADPYDVVAFNLTSLHDAIKNFRTLTSQHFALKMDPREADIYGAEALKLLESAHAAITKKYGLELRDRTIVEIFPDQKDFAIRTFGLPGGAGYLGVCFGRVITANSPASRPGSPASWEAVLWHEFTHVVTLTLTRNKMPRWLSEGISVFEERQQRGAWGEQMKPRYRAMILGDDLTPVSGLSGAFLNPKTPAHLGFAYYESSLVVEWLTQKWGLEKMKRLLADLGRGMEINAALAAHFEAIGKLDAEFAAHAQQLAKNTGPQLDWTPPGRANLASAEAADKFLAENPNNFTALFAQAQKFLDAHEWEAAKAPLKKLIALYPEQHDADSAYSLLARAHRELGETDAETATLARLADLAPDATDAFARLIELATARKDWPRVLDYSARYAAVNPLRPEPHRAAAEASEATGGMSTAIAAYRTLLALEPADPAEIHFRLARLLHAARDPEAKRHVLLALEETPRFRAALELLLEMDGQSSAPARVKKAAE